MRTYLPGCLTLALTTLPAAARFLHSLPEDTYAFPKFRVAFLNSLPLLNETAERWLREGLRGGELEFLDQPWKDSTRYTPSSPKGIDSGNVNDGISTSDPVSAPTANYSLEHMKMGPRDSYLCLIPESTQDTPPVQDEDIPDSEVTPSRSWSLLQPLSGTCLYHRQGWFTYSYCHNHEIRQFKELIHAHPPAAGGYKPEEDPDWESYTLGMAPNTGADLTVTERNARAANLELVSNAGSRYLVQKWGDGTLCDKTGRSREVEVQFHCSMAMSDTILFVKEAKTCSYVLVVHTPRLCGEPGFKSRRDTGEVAQIRCREIVDSGPQEKVNLPNADHPLKVPRRKHNLPPPATEKPGSDNGKDKKYDDMLRKAIEIILGNKDVHLDPEQVMADELADDKEMVIDILDDVFMSEGQADAVDRLTEALRKAGFDVKTEKVTVGKGNTEDKKKKKSKKDVESSHHDEL